MSEEHLAGQNLIDSVPPGIELTYDEFKSLYRKYMRLMGLPKTLPTSTGNSIVYHLGKQKEFEQALAVKGIVVCRGERVGARLLSWQVSRKL